MEDIQLCCADQDKADYFNDAFLYWTSAQTLGHRWRRGIVNDRKQRLPNRPDIAWVIGQRQLASHLPDSKGSQRDPSRPRPNWQPK